MTLDQMQAYLTALQDARYKGVRSVEFKDRKVEYRTDAELENAIRDIERRIAASSGAPVRSIVFATGRGL